MLLQNLTILNLVMSRQPKYVSLLIRNAFIEQKPRGGRRSVLVIPLLVRFQHRQIFLKFLIPFSGCYLVYYSYCQLVQRTGFLARDDTTPQISNMQISGIVKDVSDCRINIQIMKKQVGDDHLYCSCVFLPMHSMALIRFPLFYAQDFPLIIFHLSLHLLTRQPMTIFLVQRLFNDMQFLNVDLFISYRLHAFVKFWQQSDFEFIVMNSVLSIL